MFRSMAGLFSFLLYLVPNSMVQLVLEFTIQSNFITYFLLGCFPIHRRLLAFVALCSRDVKTASCQSGDSNELCCHKSLQSASIANSFSAVVIFSGDITITIISLVLSYAYANRAGIFSLCVNSASIYLSLSAPMP